jgi:hypothetical protein
VLALAMLVLFALIVVIVMGFRRANDTLGIAPASCVARPGSRAVHSPDD